jgi:hypothetical protein
VIPIMLFRTTLLTLLVTLSACTTLGPVPGTTAIAPVEAGRTTVEVSAGGVPGFYLSATTEAELEGAPIRQLSAVVEPAGALGIPGLILGARAVGLNHDIQPEPMIGYRRSFGTDRNLSALAVVHGTHASGDDNGASYEATRIGGELAADYRVLGAQPWIEPHVFASVSASGVSADGRYCADASGHGRDCESTDTPIDAGVDGVYPMATAGIALHGIANRKSWFHGARAAAMVGAGTMPRVISGETDGVQAYLTFGVMVSLAVGSAE